ncbi:hypothetical protein SBV1_470009 [Verrucomicrobia bacterium]|nr:hypothetical protein SBV1_470009 [Verrucomicrobiota bacterium]
MACSGSFPVELAQLGGLPFEFVWLPAELVWFGRLFVELAWFAEYPPTWTALNSVLSGANEPRW